MLSGRPGPVWLDIPSDISNSQIIEENLKEFKEKYSIPKASDKEILEIIKD